VDPSTTAYNKIITALAGGAASWTISRWTQVRAISGIAWGCCALWTEDGRYLSRSHLAKVGVCSLGFADLIGLCPLSLHCRLALDTTLLVATGYGGAKALLLAQQSVKKRGERVGGVICALIGGAALYQAITTGVALFKGGSLFGALDPMQQAGLLKHRALHTLSSAAERPRAVVIDGMWQKDFRSWPSISAVEAIYEKYNVSYYTVASSRQFVQAIEESCLGGKRDLLFIMGHANPQVVSLGENYLFSASSTEVMAIQRSVAEGGQVVLFGCNTATGSGSIAELLRLKLSKIEVIGIEAYLNPFLTTHSFFDGRLSLRAHFIFDLNRSFAGWQTAVAFAA
jgi:hypothetical protein